jgi:hypothetical protein
MDNMHNIDSLSLEAKASTTEFADNRMTLGNYSI